MEKQSGKHIEYREKLQNSVHGDLLLLLIIIYSCFGCVDGVECSSPESERNPRSNEDSRRIINPKITIDEDQIFFPTFWGFRGD